MTHEDSIILIVYETRTKPFHVLKIVDMRRWRHFFGVMNANSALNPVAQKRWKISDLLLLLLLCGA
jgi:hypothetical protein